MGFGGWYVEAGYVGVNGNPARTLLESHPISSHPSIHLNLGNALPVLLPVPVFRGGGWRGER